MFLISKIVRGRRLLHELEAEQAKRDAEEAAAAALAVANIAAQLPRRSGQAGRSGKLSASAATANASLSSQGGDGSPPNAASTSAATSSTRRRRSLSEQQWKRSKHYLHGRHSSSNVLRRTDSRSVECLALDGKAVRQKTDASLPDENDESSNEASGTYRVRRTSSMPSVCDVAVGARHYDYNSKLNRLQKRSLRFTWHRLQTRNGGKRVEMVFEEVYDRLLRQQTVLRDMFTTRTFLSAMSRSDTATLRDHARVTVKMIDHVIKNLDLDSKKRNDTGSEFDPILIGRAHGALRPYGFMGAYWEKLGETIIDVVLCQEAVRDLPGAGQAWVVLTACLVDQLRAGFDECRTTGNACLVQKVIFHAASHLNDDDSPEPNSDEVVPIVDAGSGPSFVLTGDASTSGEKASHSAYGGDARRRSRPDARVSAARAESAEIRRARRSSAKECCRSRASRSSATDTIALTVNPPASLPANGFTK